MNRLIRVSGSVVIGFLLAVPVTATGSVAEGVAAAQPPGTVLPGTDCPAFPADDVWNTPITGLPVNPDSATWLASMAASTTFLHPDYGPSRNPRKPYGIPWQIVAPSQPLVSVKFRYASESDPGPYPLSSSTPIERGSDRHAIMVNPLDLHSLRALRHPLPPDAANPLRDPGRSGTSSRTRSARPAGPPPTRQVCRSSPVWSTTTRSTSGVMDHAIRFTAECTQQSYLWPARHQAGQNDTSCPPMGARFRLSATFDLPASQCSTLCQTVITTMKTYGLILADNGSNWFFQGTADTRWTTTEVDQLKQIPASAFVAVDESCLMVSPNSGQAYQPGTAGYTASCG